MKHRPTIGGQNGTGCPVLPQGRGKMVQFHIFSLYLKNIIIYAYIPWLNTCIVIASRFLSNNMIIGIFLTWDHFSLAFCPDFPYIQICTCLFLKWLRKIWGAPFIYTLGVKQLIRCSLLYHYIRVDERCVIFLTMVGQSGQKAPKVPRMKSFTLENIRVSRVSCIKRYAYQKFRV